MVSRGTVSPRPVRAEPVEALRFLLNAGKKDSPSTSSGQTGIGDSPAGPTVFAGAAVKLAGFTGAFLGWSPDAFWAATPAELGAVVAALKGESDPAPPDGATIARLREAYPDG